MVRNQVDKLAPQSTGVSVSGTAAQGTGLTAGQVYAQNVQSVVLIESTVTANMYGQTATGVASGSGFILMEDGYVVTNYHVIEGASSVAVVLHDGKRYPAAVTGYDRTNDIAVLKVDAQGLDAVEIGSSSDLIVGDQVVAIGNPLGELTSTLTVGYVSAKERTVSTDGTIINMIQTDAAINSGNSGGPLFNMKGQVVGITTAKYSGASASGATIEGIGFAIPMDDVMGAVEELIQNGYIKSAYLGVMVQNMDPSAASIYGLPVGAYVVGVEEGYCAQRSGIREKDIIVAVGDVKISVIADLTRALRAYAPGDVVEIKVYRAGMTKSIYVKLDERPRDTAVQPQPQPQPEGQMPEGNYDEWFDFFAPFFGRGNDD
jgi:serine protease Do